MTFGGVKFTNSRIVNQGREGSQPDTESSGQGEAFAST